MTRHARQVHDGPKPLRCPHCDYKTADRSNYKKHVELHLRPRQFLCPLCSYAASKKCNLQYHLKSRHRGCTVDHLDLSKVKLRVKRPDSRKSGEEQEEEQEQQDQEEEEEESTPINLSVRKSSRSTSTALDKVQKKVGQVPEKVQKVLTRGKKIQDKEDEGEQDLQDQDTQAENLEGQRTKKKAKKVPAQRKTVPQGPESSPDLQRPADLDQSRSLDVQRAKQQGDLRTEEHQEPQKSSGDGEKDLKRVIKSRRSGCKSSEETKEDGVQRAKRPQADLQVKEKPPKRKISEALDLSSKASSETRSKSRRLKIAISEVLNRSSPATSRSRTGKQKKNRNTSKKVVDLQEAPEPPVSGGPGESTPPEPTRSEPGETSTHKKHVDLIRPAEPEEILPDPAGPEKNQDQPAETEENLDQENLGLPAGPEETPNNPRGQEKIPDLPAEPEETLDLPAGPEETQEDPAQVDDEGIHSSPEAGSDISDSSSEGSDDSGLKMANDPETPTGDLLSPQTPDLLVPPMTVNRLAPPPNGDLLAPHPSGGEEEGLKSLLCIFCDRSFPLQAQYQRHLQRHLVNVYFLDNLGPGK